MTTIPNPAQAPRQRAGATIISGPWPSYAGFRDLPDRDRWVLYGSAKAYREALELQGLVMSESYDAFVRRVTEELEL
ncbi:MULTISPECIES: hypothetical protein [unclassified Pseudomonas]|uniref:hypothetical protein n=1 Tax=unclassified Pseudomonas TaxID=196821 RepID=UPI00209771FA|nr:MULTISPECIES: hypothetical protein [unclassified Pseudomonas]MCO7519421.1 hypothetical protein [Pseudomonas sp. 1]MCO7541827.1 hypothetical protein [Pseudomonas sp. VA159-2]